MTVKEILEARMKYMLLRKPVPTHIYCTYEAFKGLLRTKTELFGNPDVLLGMKIVLCEPMPENVKGDFFVTA